MAKTTDLTKIAGSAAVGASEKQVIRQGRQNSGKQSHKNAVFVGANKRKKIDRQKDQSALRNKMC